MSAADTIARVATKKALVVVKSTVPVGTCDKVQKRLESSKLDLEVVTRAFTLVGVNPALDQFTDIADELRDLAERNAADSGRKLAARRAAA